MRGLRPELYSDSSHRDAYRVDPILFGYKLEHITAQNETHEFEFFCRKLAEQTICAHIKPSTGPDGGGDAKVDADTLPISEDITRLYIGDAPIAGEKYAFAISAKKEWEAKVRADVASIHSTGRTYARIYCITAREAKAKIRAALEDSLSKEYGMPVEILDRTWITNEIIDKGRQKLAFDYLKVGEVVTDRRVGPQDYSRAQELDEIEAAIKDPTQFEGLPWQLVTEALQAAKLSRQLERPRFETDGRFTRAIRLADQQGTPKQRCETRYEAMWTALWWFDDIGPVNEQYETLEQMLEHDSYDGSLELLGTLVVVLMNAVLIQHKDRDDLKVEARMQRLDVMLERCMANITRPNNALGATVGKIRLDLCRFTMAGDRAQYPSIWKRFEEVIDRAEGLGEFPARDLVRTIEAVANAAGPDPSYTALIAKLADFVERRTGAATGALMKLKRARQLSPDDSYELIRLLGEVAHRLTQKEYVDELLESSTLLSTAYFGAGLYWAARASALLALANGSIRFEQDQYVAPEMLNSALLLSWCSIGLLHIPDVVVAARTTRLTASAIPLEPADVEDIQERLLEIDVRLGAQILQLSTDGLARLTGAAGALLSVPLEQSHTCLLYALGHEATLRREGWIPSEETAEGVKEYFKLLAGKFAAPTGPLVLNEGASEVFSTKVLGMRVTVSHPTNDSAVLIAEAIVGGLEAVFATTPELDVHAHTEHFSILVETVEAGIEPTFEVDPHRLEAIVRWPDGRLPASIEHQIQTREQLATLLLMVLHRTCVMQDDAHVVERLIKSEKVLERLTMILVAGSSRHRFFSAPVGRLPTEGDDGKPFEHYPVKPDRPSVPRTSGKIRGGASSKGSSTESAAPPQSTGHRDLKLRSFIDNRLWDEARWRGVAYPIYEPEGPPTVLFAFERADAAEAIFQQWIDRLGNDDVNDELHIAAVRGLPNSPLAHYRILVTSALPKVDDADDFTAVFARHMTMEPSSDENLVRFLERFEKVGWYFLVPAVLKPGNEPEILSELSLKKHAFKCVMAKDVQPNDVEIIAVKVGAAPDRSRS